MDFTLSEAQAELAGLARKILAEREEPWADLAAAGVLAAGLPESLDGAGLGLLEQCSVLTELGRAASDVPYLASIVLGAGAIAAFGTAAAAAPLGAARRGSGSVVLTAALPRRTAMTVVALGPRRARAGRFVGLVRGEDRGPGRPAGRPVPGAGASADGVLVFLVAPSDAGVSVRAAAADAFAPAGRVVLDGVVLGDDRVLGPGGPSGGLAGGAGDRGTVRDAGRGARAGAGADRRVRADPGAVRPADRLVPGGGAAAGRRLHRRGGGPADDVAGRLAAVPRACPLDVEVATAKFWAADAGHRVAHTAVHVHGGLGIDVSYPVHRYFAAAKGNEFALGGATAQLRRIGAALARLRRGRV